MRIDPIKDMKKQSDKTGSSHTRKAALLVVLAAVYFFLFKILFL